MINLFTVILAASYLTLGFFSSHKAKTLWAPYAIVIFVLSIISLFRAKDE